MVERKPLELFYVVYEQGNLASKALAFISLSPNLVATGLFAAFAATRRIWWFWTFTGVVLTDILCVVGKKVMDQPRPHGSYKSGPGMPSEHAAFAAFFAVYLMIRMVRFVRCRPVPKILAIFMVWFWATMVVISRHHLGVHSWEQLLVGSGFGCFMAAIWLFVEITFRPKLREVQQIVNSIWKSLDIHCDDGLNQDSKMK
mmetsp:Transcript_13753/g.20962  ORF Transcript_13753/g.20962 Transcript_13753/m.20962 type:complete len:200 (-) Transcript_13753:335-934(-)|eukprot:CAMPEP_0178913850 /NCGR_PEP_ID=MMETSP0786-20121207/11077_1 /TAXON_ID=186022 /ORGANISM="Thalassionema frauenfeldii, Strain CCMP 1798" /LENGTH=199 /DNA_ID=CAMNT_0020586649 /DNA_START=68 /DNA_END=667 /DNA_ORIENTATION=+